MRLILVRHAETEENLKNIMQGHLPGKLTPLGREQAKKIALRLKNDKIDYVYSSDSARCVDTAKEIIKLHKKVPVQYLPDLRERSVGIYQGMTHGEIKKTIKPEDYDNPKDGENREKFSKRVVDFVHQLLHKHLNQTLLLVTHGGFIRIIFKDIFHQPEPEWTKNTSLTVVEIDENKNHKLILFNCVKHLE